MNYTKEINLFLALGKFLEAIRLFVSTEMKKKHGDSWDRKYFEKLIPQLQDSWGKRLQEGIDPINLIDFGNLNSFAIGAKEDFFNEFFGKKKHNLPTIFNELAEVRNITAHYLPFDNIKAEKAYLHMIELAKNLEMTELDRVLMDLKGSSFGSEEVPIQETATPRGISNIQDQRIPSKITKSAAIKLINVNTGQNGLSSDNTVFSNVNKTSPVWWLNIPPAKFDYSLNILLVEKDELIWINLPANTCNPPSKFFNTRNDNGKIDLRIGIKDNDYLSDILSDKNFNFKPYMRERFKI